MMKVSLRTLQSQARTIGASTTQHQWTDEDRIGQLRAWFPNEEACKRFIAYCAEREIETSEVTATFQQWTVAAILQPWQ